MLHITTYTITELNAMVLAIHTHTNCEEAEVNIDNDCIYANDWDFDAEVLLDSNAYTLEAAYYMAYGSYKH